MNSFIENVNYVANLDNKYGSSIEIYKNNLSLRTELHDIVFTLEYYNFTDKKLHTLEYSYNDMSIDNFNSTLLNLKSQVELTGLFDCVVSFSYTNFIINNVASIHIKITSKSENIKTYGLNLNITKDLTEIYNINGIVSDTLKILPYLSSIDKSIFDGIINVSNNIEAIQNTEENANIAITQANIAISKANEALSSANSASASETISIEKSSIAIAKASEAFTSASEALASENAAKSSETNSSINEVNASTSANNASISEANALASANSASVSSAIAINKSTEASASASNALDSENSALDSKNSAIASATTAITKASEAFSSAVSASTQAEVATTKAGEASTSATNAAASATSATTAATTATTKASEASISATSAAASATDASTSATESATSAGQSATSASSAASSATDANISKLAAASSASDASASAVSANQSALDAIEALDEFTDIYLGRKATAPTVDNDGNALVEGTIYWNTTLKSLFIYDGTMWDPAVFDASGAVVSFNGRSGAITLTNADVTGATGQDLSVVGAPSFASVKVTGGTGAAGTMSWNSDESTADLVLENGVTLQVGQENNRLVRNATGVAITNMTVCMFAGTIGNSGRVKVAPFDGLFTHTHYIYGIATHNIAAGADGYITIDGKVREVNTTGSLVGETWADGDILYAKPNDNGRLTNVEPADDELKIIVASVVNAHANGTLEVRVLPFNENMIAKRANKLTTARTISLSGDASGSVDFDGSANVSMTVTVADDSHLHSFANITNKPTTLNGFGITDAYTKAEVDTIVDNLDALPSQTGFAGKYLKTDGTVATWESSMDDSTTSTTSTWSSDKIDEEITEAVGSIDLSSKQDVLVSGTSIKTVNGISVLGSGDITLAVGTDVIEVSVSTAMQVFTHYVVKDGGVSLTLPSSVVVGDKVIISTSGHYVTILRNGYNIGFLAEDLVVDVLNTTVKLQYINLNEGWRIV